MGPPEVAKPPAVGTGDLLYLIDTRPRVSQWRPPRVRPGCPRNLPAINHGSASFFFLVLTGPHPGL